MEILVHPSQELFKSPFICVHYNDWWLCSRYHPAGPTPPSLKVCETSFAQNPDRGGPPSLLKSVQK